MLKQKGLPVEKFDKVDYEMRKDIKVLSIEMLIITPMMMGCRRRSSWSWMT